MVLQKHVLVGGHQTKRRRLPRTEVRRGQKSQKPSRQVKRSQVNTLVETSRPTRNSLHKLHALPDPFLFTLWARTSKSNSRLAGSN